MKEFSGAFLGTLAAILFVCGIVAYLMWREMQKLEAKPEPKREPELEREPGPVVAPREPVGHPSQVPS